MKVKWRLEMGGKQLDYRLGMDLVAAPLKVGSNLYIISKYNSMMYKVDLDTYELHYLDKIGNTFRNMCIVEAMCKIGKYIYMLPRYSSCINRLDINSDEIELDEILKEDDVNSLNKISSAVVIDDNIYCFRENGPEILRFDYRNNKVTVEQLVRKNVNVNYYFISDVANINEFIFAPLSEESTVIKYDTMSKKVEYIEFESEASLDGFIKVQAMKDSVYLIGNDGQIYGYHCQNNKKEVLSIDGLKALNGIVFEDMIIFLDKEKKHLYRYQMQENRCKEIEFAEADQKLLESINIRNCYFEIIEKDCGYMFFEAMSDYFYCDIYADGNIGEFHKISKENLIDEISCKDKPEKDILNENSFPFSLQYFLDLCKRQ